MIELKITVIPRAQRREVIDLGGDHFRVKLTSAPEKDKANRELIRVLAQHFGVKKSAVTIKTGQKSRHKIIKILQ
jgi:uncharacterized protein (TIGR00251 family)